MKQLLVIALASALILSLGSCTSTDSMGSKPMTKAASVMKDGIYLKDGKVMETMGGKTSDLMMDITLKDGTKIMVDGTVMMKDGSKTMLMQGEFYGLDGMKTMADPMM